MLEFYKADHKFFLPDCNIIEDTLWFKREYRFRLQTEKPRFPAEATERMELADLSLLKCCNVIENGSSILAWLAEGTSSMCLNIRIYNDMF